MITLTETAAKKISDLRLEEGKPEWGLRIRIVGGGCSGSGVNGGGAAGVDVVDGGFWDGVGVVAEVILNAVVIRILILTLADLVGRDGASIL